jgi:hypothetical protein
MGPPTLNLVPPAPFPQPLASDIDELPAVIVDETDLPTQLDDTDSRAQVVPVQVEPLPSHPEGLDRGEAVAEPTGFNIADDGIIHDSLTLGELRKYVHTAFKVKVN